MGNKIQKIYIGDHNQVYPTWKPGANTLAYFPLNGNTNDYSGNGFNLTPYNITYNTLPNGKSAAYFNGTTAYALNTTIDKTLSGGTFNVWIKKYRNNSDEVLCQLAITPSGSVTGDGGRIIRSTSTQVGNITHTLYYNAFVFDAVKNTGIPNLTWMNVAAVAGSSGNKLYINGQEVSATYNYGNSSTPFGSIRFNRLSIARHQHVAAEYAQCEVSERIIEDKVWTAQEVVDYYNQTKGKYLGIS